MSKWPISKFFTISFALKKKTAIIILGPTAVGKTPVAVDLAIQFGTKIISADSRQCFKELNIGVAKPSVEQLKAVHHFFIGSHSIFDEINASVFEKLAHSWAHDIFEMSDFLVMVGGTGLYIRAFCEGLDEIPMVENGIRNELRAQYEIAGLDWLREQVKVTDPGYFLQGENQNPQRMLRALEVKLGTGRSILSFQQNLVKEREFRVLKIGLQMPKHELCSAINSRVDKMISDGLLLEVERLGKFRNLNALRTVGYAEILSYLENQISLDEAISLIKRNTRRYARRQMTWFRKDPEITWIHPDDKHKIKNITES